jgi:hypothetical protein
MVMKHASGNAPGQHLTVGKYFLEADGATEGLNPSCNLFFFYLKMETKSASKT